MGAFGGSCGDQYGLVGTCGELWGPMVFPFSLFPSSPISTISPFFGTPYFHRPVPMGFVSPFPHSGSLVFSIFSMFPMPQFPNPFVSSFFSRPGASNVSTPILAPPPLSSNQTYITYIISFCIHYKHIVPHHTSNILLYPQSCAILLLKRNHLHGGRHSNSTKNLPAWIYAARRVNTTESKIVRVV